MRHLLLTQYRMINWKRGNGSIYFGLIICVMAVFMMIMLMEFSNVRFVQDITSSRADMIADSVAVYAQSYDYKYNKSQAATMATLLTTYNNNASNKYDLTTNLSFSGDDVLTVKSTVKAPVFFPGLAGNEWLTAHDSSTVKSVNVFGNVFVVPESLGHKNEPKETDVVGNGGADLASP